MNTQSFDAYGLIVILILAVAMPLLGIWDFKRLMNWLEEGRDDARVVTYRWILMVEWALTLALAGWWLAAGRGLEGLGLVPAIEGWQWLAVGLGLAGAVFMIGQMVMVLRDPDQLRQVQEKGGEMIALGPQTDAEGRLFTAVSVTAGVCEEIIYRGVLLAVLTPVIGVWPAVGLSSLIFGMGHAYQGPAGIVKTSLIGLIMALLTVFTGSIFVPIVLHAVIDLTNGRLLAEANRQVAPLAEAAETVC